MLIRFVKFGAVGALGVAINMAAFWALTTGLGLHYLFAAPWAIELALCSNYVLNHNWTFADRSSGRADRKQFTQYHAVSIGGMLINLVALQVMAGMLGMPPMLANLCGIAAGTAWNFGINANWTWRKTPAALAASE